MAGAVPIAQGLRSYFWSVVRRSLPHIRAWRLFTGAWESGSDSDTRYVLACNSEQMINAVQSQFDVQTGVRCSPKPWSDKSISIALHRIYTTVSGKLERPHQDQDHNQKEFG